MYTLSGKKIWVAGHRGMVGSSIVRRLSSEQCEILTVGRDVLDLRDQVAVGDWLCDHRPDAVVLAAGRVGGIVANSTYPVDFLLDNLLIATAVIAGAYRSGVEKLLYLGSSCIYPRLASQPIPETALLSGPLEPTNQWYAVAKIAGIKLVQAHRAQYNCDFISAMPTNLYGPGDSFDPMLSHVLPALIRKVDDARKAGSPVEVWGSGTPRREFLYVDDCADACVHLLKVYSDEDQINVGSGSDISILELTKLVMDVVGYDGGIVFDQSRPDGTPRKLLDVSRINELGWRATTSLTEGIARAYAAFCVLNRDAPDHFGECASR